MNTALAERDDVTIDGEIVARRTIDHADIRWRVGQISKKDAHKGSLLGYIDARTCMEALDRLDANWSAEHGEPIIVGGELVGVPCKVTVNGVTRSDVGMPSSQEPIKGAYSDALKRAAVHFGIGRELYELPRIYVKLDDYKKPVAIPTYRNGRWTLPSGAGSVFYDREPDEQPEQGGRGATPATRPAPAQRTAEEQELLDELLAIPGMTHARMSLLADAVGIPKGERANADQLREMLATSAIELPEPAAVPTPVAPADPSVAPVAEDEGQAGSSDPPASTPSDTAPADAVTSAAPTPAAGASPPGSAPPAATYSPETFRTLLAAVLELDVAGDWKLTDLDATDWSTVWTALGVGDPDAYKVWHSRQPREVRMALTSAKQSPRARADAAKAEPVQETLSEAIGNPVEGSES